MGSKSIFENHSKCFGYFLEVDTENDNADKKISNSHDGNYFFGNGSDSLYTADENERADNSKNYTYGPCGNIAV